MVLGNLSDPFLDLPSPLFIEAQRCRDGMERPMEEGWCPQEWFYVLCWPPTRPNTTASLPCLADLYGIRYDTSYNVTRWCYDTGQWANYSNHNACVVISNDETSLPTDEKEFDVAKIYVIGYALSLIALAIAVTIFLYFKDLRCLRNTIHTNLMVTYIVVAFFWIMIYSLPLSIASNIFSCIFFYIMLHYFHLTNFFWMFVEGLYLYMLVVETFTRENIKLRVYMIIGWGIPVVIVLAWAITRMLTSVDIDDPSRPTGDPQSLDCEWMNGHSSDWIYQGSALAVLVLNFIFLIRIMWVLITKLRSANNVETQQYRKATKALLVLIPLLGITYILFITGPTHGVYANIYNYVRAALISTQGLEVAIFYCFLNTEVRNTVHHHFDRWKEARDLGRRYTLTKDWSPNTRTESIRLYSKHELAPSHYKKRESTVSETTTLTMVGGSNRVSNGSMATSLTVRAPTSPYLEAPML